MMYRVLGQLSVGEHGELPLPTGRELGVLAVLLMNPNKRVSTAELRRKVWGDVDIRDVQVHKRVSGIRTMLDRAGRRDDVVTHPGFGYELRVGPDDHDLLQFQQLLRTADEPAHRGTEREIDLLRSALRLWRGARPLIGVPGDFVEALGADLRFRRTRAMVRLCDLEFARGRHADVIDELRTAFGYQPTDGRLCLQFMLALHHGGHVMEALAAYERHAAALEAESASAPDGGLRSLKFAIASGDEATIAQLENAGGRRGGRVERPVAVPRQLPPDLPDFIGRADLVQESRWLLSREQRTAPAVVVLTGPGGIGKTALATHVAHLVRGRYPDGQLYLELGGTTPQPRPPGELMAQALRAFDVATVPDRDDERISAYRTLLGDKRVLLVLDDVLDEEQVRDLIPGNPGCGVLLTARRRLTGLTGAHHLSTLEPLPDDEANKLFQSIVRAAGVDPAGDPEATARIVALCAGLPLAIWVTGALCGRGDGLTAGGLLQRLVRQGLPSLTFAGRSVEGSIAAGLEHLDPLARRLFFGLGLLQLPEFGIWTAEAVLDATGQPPEDPYEVLMRLARRHLLHPVGEGRYRFHELTRAYARRSSPPGDEVVERVYATLLTLARRAHRGIYGGDYEVVHSAVADREVSLGTAETVDRAPLSWFETERDNLQAALRHAADLGLTGIAWDLAASPHEFYNLRGYLDDLYTGHRRALTACRAAGDDRGAAVMLALLGQPALVASRRQDVSGEPELTEAVRLFRQCGDPHGEAIARRTLGAALRREGRFDEALTELRLASELYRQCGDAVGLWQSLRYVGQTHLDRQDYPAALRELRDAATAAQLTGAPRLVAQSAYWLGRTHLAMHDPVQAREHFSRVLVAVGDAEVVGRAYAYQGLGDVAADEGDEGEARRSLGLALELARQGGDARLEGRILLSLARLHESAGDAAAAAEACDLAIACFADARADYLLEQARAARRGLPQS